MNKQLFFSIVLLITLGFYFGCRKMGSPQSGLPSADQVMIDNARSAFVAGMISSVEGATNSGTLPTLRKQSAKTPIWDRAYTMQVSKTKLVIVPLHYQQGIYFKTGLDLQKMYAIDNSARLIIYQDNNKIYHSQIVTIMPDSSFNSKKSFSGIILVEDWAGNFLDEYKYKDNAILKLKKIPTAKVKIDMVVVQVCYSMEEYNYSVDDPEGGVYSSEPLGCDTYFFADNTGGGGFSGSDYAGIGSGGGGSASSSTIVVNRGNNVIASVPQYIQCFGNIPSATYSITLYVDQPSPGHSTSYASSGPGSIGLSVGHAFLTFQEQIPGLATPVRRAMGLYPAGNVTPLTPSSQGSLNNDGGHHYDISLTITLPGASFMNVVNAFSNGNNVGYNLNSNNCVTWALSSLAAGGIIINTTPGSWPFGSGDDPGNLGEDIRKMALTPNMTRSTVATTAPANAGSCQ